MAAKHVTDITPQAERLRRLSVVFAVELRLKIVTELYMREMSASQFYEEFGGGTLPRVAQNFDRLAKTGWLRHVRNEGPGGDRRGGVERVYRAPELAYFDTPTWALMPYSIRAASSWSIFKQIAARLCEALETTSSGEGEARDLTSIQLELDQVGWERVTEAVGAQFVSLLEEQRGARLRAADSTESLLHRADVFLVTFESPGPGDEQVGPSLAESKSDPMIPFPERLSPLLADELCMRIVAVLNEREMSATQFHRELGGASIGGVSRRFKRLETAGWLKRVKRQRGGRRGATEVFYRATKPAIVDDAPWKDPSDSLQEAAGWPGFERFFELAKEAMTVGTFDARIDRSVTWSMISLDQQGWENVTAEIEELLATMLEEQESAKRRLAESGEKPITMTVGLAAFKALKNVAKAL